MLEVLLNVVSSNVFNLNAFLKIVLNDAYFAHHTFEAEKLFLKESLLNENVK